MSVLNSFLASPRRESIRGWRRACVAALSAATALFAGAAHAQTTGLQLDDTGDLILQRLGFSQLYVPSSLVGTTPTLINFNGITFNYIQNPYMAVVQGVRGTYPVAFAQNQFLGNSVTLTHNVPGMLSFGNISGSLRITNDDRRALNGFGQGEAYADLLAFSPGLGGGGRPAGYGVWPLAGWLYEPSSRIYDYSAYVSANVDGIQTGGAVTGGTTQRIVGGDGNWIIIPTFRANAGGGIAGDNVLLSEAQMPNDCVLHQEVRLFRNTAQMTWRVRNTGAVAHTVYLKFVVNNHAASTFKINGNTGQLGQLLDPAYYYTDPEKGPTLRSQVYGVNPDGTPRRTVPTQIDVLGGRYQADTALIEPFHGRLLFSGFGATAPTTVFVGDSEDLFPDGALFRSFSPPRTGIRYDKIEDGIAVAAYYGPISVAPGATSAPIVTYYGNGDSTDQLDSDFTTATEAEEAFQYNANAAATLTTQQRSNPTLGDTARAFLTPQLLTVYGSVYNRQLAEAQFNIILKDVRMSLTLPDGLRFATVPTTGQPDTATKVVGDIPGDTDKVATWLVEPTGEQFGTFSYQLIANVGGISPLSRTVNRSVTIPATPLVNVSADYFQQIGFPFDFDANLTNNSDAATILNTLSKPSDTNPGSYVFYEWVPDPDSQDGSGRYVPTSNLERGKGYFYRPNLSRLLFLNGARPDAAATPIDPSTQVQYYQRVVERGWNMISNPFVYAVPVSFVSIANIDNNNVPSDLQQTAFGDAVASGVVRGGIFFYNPFLNSGLGGYDFFQDFTQQELKPYQGYWVYFEERKILRIAVPSQKQTAVIPAADGSVPFTTRKKQTPGAIASGRAFPTNQTTDNWKLQIAAKQSGSDAQNGRSDSTALIGVSPLAKDGDDSRDLPKPPPIVNGYVSTRILHEVKSGKTRGFAQDLKAPGGKKTWEIEVTSDKDGPVSLSWPNLSRLPKTVRLTLTDTKTGRATPLRSSSSIVVNVSAGTPSRFVITADKQASRALAFTSVRFKSEGRAAGGGFNYSLSFKTTADATVEAQIVSLSGKVVNNLGGRAVAAGGETRLLWGGRSQSGAALPVGPYKVELSARGEDGERIVQSQPITLLQ